MKQGEVELKKMKAPPPLSSLLIPPTNTTLLPPPSPLPRAKWTARATGSASTIRARRRPPDIKAKIELKKDG